MWLHGSFFSEAAVFLLIRTRCGMSGGGALSLLMGEDSGSIDAAQPEGPVTLLGISQGAATCIHYVLRHPERVERLILYGGYAHGARKRGTPDHGRAHQAMIELARVAWAKDNPTFRQVFTSRFIPGGTPAQLEWFNDLCLKTTSGEVVASLLERAAMSISPRRSQRCGCRRWSCTRARTK